MTDKFISLTEEQLEPFRELKLLDEVRLRDLHIIQEYYRRQQTETKKSKYKIEEELADENNIAPATVHWIIATEKKKKRQQPIVKALV